MILLVLVLIGGLTFSGYWFICPCETLPGGPVQGEVDRTPVEDWQFVNDIEAVPLCQIQVDFTLPRSMNVNCMSTGGDLFVSCSGCADKQWSARALKYPDGFVRAGETVYPISYERVTDEAMLDRVWYARLAKIDADLTPRPYHWWTFRLVYR